MDSSEMKKIKKVLHDSDPNYWVKSFEGTPMSIMIPPYIRFLEGLVVLQNALKTLQVTEICASQGISPLSEVFAEFEQGKEARLHGITFEKYFASQLVITLVSEVEHFFSSAVSAALRLHPNKMGSHSFKLSEIITVSSNQELIDRAAGSVLNELMYEKPLIYMEKFSNILSIQSDSFSSFWLDYIELKARRDLGVHNNWAVNEIYLRKLGEANIAKECSLNDSLIPDFNYLISSSERCQQLVKQLVGVLGEKWMKNIRDPDS